MEDKTGGGDEMARVLGADRQAGPLRRMARWAAAALVLLAAAAAIFLWWERAREDKAPRYITRPAERGALTVTVTATGTLQPVNQVDVGSEISGTIEKVEVDYNDRVKAGQVLVRLDTDRLEAEVKRSEAALEAARASLLEAQATVKEARNALARLERVLEMSGGKVPSRNDLDAAEAALKRAEAQEASARASVSESQATLDANRTNLSKAIIRSPIDGVVLTRNVEPGQTVAASLQAPVLLTLAEDLTKMELHVDVDEADVGEVREGQDAVFTVDAYPGREFRAAITQVRFGSKTVEGVVTYETVLRVDNSDLSLRPGMTATADITVRKVEGAVLVPNAALRFSPPPSGEEQASGGGLVSKLFPRPRMTTQRPRNGGSRDKGQRVWTLRDGKPAPITVAIGPTDGRMTQVLSGGVEPGTPLVVDMEAGGK
ncbi:MAG: efflux RND transporter periplasmic adaptor subunit [Thermodesulfovibrionales bacterium]